MADQPVIDWNTIRPEATGHRGYRGPEVEQKAAWKCPACGEENAGPLGDGCTHCHSGGGAKHVGVDPVVRKEDRLSGTAIEPVFAVTNMLTTALNTAFWAYVNSRTPRTSIPDPFETFKAGWDARGGSVAEVTDHPDGVPTVAPVVEAGAAETAPTFLGTAKNRTLVAALEFFRDQLLPQEPEELITGEWLSKTDIAILILTLKDTLK